MVTDCFSLIEGKSQLILSTMLFDRRSEMSLHWNVHLLMINQFDWCSLRCAWRAQLALRSQFLEIKWSDSKICYLASCDWCWNFPFCIVARFSIDYFRFCRWCREAVLFRRTWIINQFILLTWCSRWLMQRKMIGRKWRTIELRIINSALDLERMWMRRHIGKTCFFSEQKNRTNKFYRW